MLLHTIPAIKVLITNAMYCVCIATLFYLKYLYPFINHYSYAVYSCKSKAGGQQTHSISKGTKHKAFERFDCYVCLFVVWYSLVARFFSCVLSVA
jgi:hypothetical protein